MASDRNGKTDGPRCLEEHEAKNPGGAGLFSPHQEEADQQKIRGDVPGGCNAARHLLGRSAFGGVPSSASHSAYKREPQQRARACTRDLTGWIDSQFFHSRELDE